MKNTEDSDFELLKAKEVFDQIKPPFDWDKLFWYSQFYGEKSVRRGILKYRGVYSNKRKYEEFEAVMRGDEINIYSRGLEEDLRFFKDFDRKFKIGLKDNTFKNLLDYDFYDVVDSLRSLIIQRRTIPGDIDEFLLDFLDNEKYNISGNYWINFYLRARMNSNILSEFPVEKNLELTRFLRLIKKRAPGDERFWMFLENFWFQYEEDIFYLMENEEF